MIANFVAFAIQFGINFLFTPYLIRTIGKEAYSFFPLANSFISYAGILTIALNSMASRFITIKLEQNDNEGARIYLTSLMYGNTFMAIALTIPSVLMVVFMDKILNIPPSILYDVQWLFALVLLGMILNILFGMYEVATYAKNKLYLSSIRNAESNILRVVLLVGLFFTFKPAVSYIGIANLAVVVFIIITNIKYTKLLLPSIQFNNQYFRLSAIKELLRSGVWNSINRLSNVLKTSVDLLIANIFLGASLTGELALAKTLPMFIYSLVITMVTVFSPEFTILFAQNKSEELKSSIKGSLKFMSTLMTIPLGFLMVMGEEFFTLWIPGQNAHLLYILSGLTLIPLVISTSIEPLFHVFTVTNKLKIPSIFFMISGIINVVAILVLLKFTSMGVLAIPIVGLVMAIMQHLFFTPIFAAKVLHIKWNTFYFSIFRGIFNCLLIMGLTLILKEYVYHRNWISFLTIGILGSTIALAINLLLFFSKQEVVDFLTRIKIIKTNN